MPTYAQNEINELKDCMVQKVAPLRIYLFGSFAEGKQKDDSDYDFYIVVDDSQKDISGITTEAYKSVRKIKKRPVDIVVGTASRFEERKNKPTLEYEVDKKGILLYE